MTRTTIAGSAIMMRWIETRARDENNFSRPFDDWDDPWSCSGLALLGGRLAAAIEKAGSLALALDLIMVTYACRGSWEVTICNSA